MEGGVQQHAYTRVVCDGEDGEWGYTRNVATKQINKAPAVIKINTKKTHAATSQARNTRAATKHTKKAPAVTNQIKKTHAATPAATKQPKKAPAATNNIKKTPATTSQTRKTPAETNQLRKSTCGHEPTIKNSDDNEPTPIMTCLNIWPGSTLLFFHTTRTHDCELIETKSAPSERAS